MHFYKFHIKDYAVQTPHLSNEEDLAYRRLLDYYYQTEAPIPTAIPPLSRRFRIAEEVLCTVLNEFFEKTEEGWKNRRCDEEIAEYHNYIEKQRHNGKRGGRPSSKSKKTHRKPTANPPLTHGKPTVKPTINHKPLTNNKDNISCYLPLAKKLKDLVSTKKNRNITDSQERSWAECMRLTAERDGFSLQRQQEAMAEYEKHFGEQYWPEIESGKSWREKFSKLENAINRTKTKPEPKFVGPMPFELQAEME